MKEIFMIGLLCTTLIFSACGSSVGGGYSGSLDIGGSMYERGTDVLAVVIQSGATQTIEFAKSEIIKNCKLRIYTADDRISGDGQTCEVTAGGKTEILKVVKAGYFDSSYAGLKSITVNITGSTLDGKTVSVSYLGFQK